MEYFLHEYQWQEPPRAMPQLLYTRHAGYRSPANPEIYRGAHNAWVINASPLPDSCRFRQTSDAPWQIRNANEVHVIRPGTYFEDQILPGREMRQLFIIFRNGESVGLEELFPSRDPGFILRIDDREQRLIKPLIAIARIADRRKREGFAEAQCQLMLLLAELQCGFDDLAGVRHGTAGADSTPGQSEFVRTVDRYLACQPAQPLSRKQLADRMQISVSLLSHRYQQECGKSPMQRRRELRLKLAATLLLRGDTLEEIALAAGFAGASHLSLAFKKHYGLAPSDYRRQIPIIDRPAFQGND